jgi:hypothetical protein
VTSALLAVPIVQSAAATLAGVASLADLGSRRAAAGPTTARLGHGGVAGG